MKQILPLIICFISLTALAQSSLAPDQNPNYLISQQKYMQHKDSLQSTMNTTVQQTYKAYDWYQAKLERKQNRIENRNQRRLYNSYYNGSRYYNAYDYSGYNGYRNNYYGNRYRSPYTGYRSGNWWFWF
jgi:signal transduction histidine kinase